MRRAMNADLTRRLHQLGIDYESVGALLILPLVEVAWAKGQLEPAEANRIIVVAQDWELSEESLLMVRGWLRYPPSLAYGQRARAALSQMLSDGVPFRGPWDAEVILDEAKAIAAVGGSWLSFLRSRAPERAVITQYRTNFESGKSPAPGIEAHPDLERRVNQVTLDFDHAQFTDTARGVLIADFEHGVRVDLAGLGLTVGSSPDADLCVLDCGLMPIHCRFTARGEWHYLEEVGGETRVNGERIGMRRLLGGETVRLARGCSFAFKRVRQVDPVQGTA